MPGFDPWMDGRIFILLTFHLFEIKYNPHNRAGVAELADALRSGRSELTLMRVQIPPSAHLPADGGHFIYQTMDTLSPLIPKKLVLNSLKLILILALLAGFFYYIPLSNILNVLKTVSLPPLFWTLVLGILAIYGASIKLWVLTRKQGIDIPVHKLFVLNLTIRFYSFFSPVSSVGSLLRWQRLAIDGKAAEGLVAVAANRVLDIIVAITVGLFWAITALNQEMVNVSLTVSYLIIFLFFLWFLIRISDPLAVWAQRKKAVSRHPITAKGFSLLSKLFLSLGIYRSFSWLEVIILVFTALGTELFSLLAYVLIALSMHISISVVDLGWMRALLFLAALAPFTLAGGFGLREVSAVVLMSGMGIAADRAAAFSLLIYTRSMVISLIGGGLELVLFLFERSPRRK